MAACAGSPAPPARRSQAADSAQADSARADSVPLDTLLARLHRGTPEARIDAAAALARPGPRMAERVSALSAALRDTSQKLGLRAAWALGQIGEPSVPTLLQALGDRRPDVRMRAVYAIGAVGPAAAPAAPAVTRALTDPNRSVRDMASWTIGQIGPQAPRRGGAALGGSEDLAAGLAAPNPLDRVAALRRFQPYAADDGKAIPLLIRTLGDADSRVSRAAADALVLLGSAARGPLSAALSDSSAAIRQGAAAALVRLGRAGP